MFSNFIKHLVYFFNSSSKVFDNIFEGEKLDEELLKSYARSAIWLTTFAELKEKYPQFILAEGTHLFNGRLQKYFCTTVGLVLLADGEDAEWLRFHAVESGGVGFLTPEVHIETAESGRFVSKSYGGRFMLTPVRYHTKEMRAARAAEQEKQAAIRAHYEQLKASMLKQYAYNNHDRDAAVEVMMRVFHHDYHFDYSDDIQVYRRGRADRDWLEAELRRLGIPVDVIGQYHNSSATA